jgi:hypothetical protein
MSSTDPTAGQEPLPPDANASDAPVPDPDEQRDVEPTPEPGEDPSDPHTGPLDDDEDGRFLERDDPRRVEAERRRGKAFDDDEPYADEGQDEGEAEQEPDDGEEAD